MGWEMEGRGSQGASRGAPGKSGLHARGEGERVLALESRDGTRARDALKKDSRGLSRGAAGNPRVPLYRTPCFSLPHLPTSYKFLWIMGYVRQLF